MNESGPRLVVFGATGLAGDGVLHACLDAKDVQSVVAITRRPLSLSHPRLQVLVANDFVRLDLITPHVAGVNACFYCLGTASSGVKEADYRVITKDYALEAARVLKNASPGHVFHFISGGGTSLNSRFMWARLKAETEEALKSFGLAGAICYRPAAILSDRLPSRAPLSVRIVYPLAGRVLRYFPAWSIDAYDIGLAMLQLQQEGARSGTLENPAIRSAASRYRARTNVQST